MCVGEREAFADQMRFGAVGIEVGVWCQVSSLALFDNGLIFKESINATDSKG